MYDLSVLKQGDASTSVRLLETDKSFVLGIPQEAIFDAKLLGVVDHPFFTDLQTPAFYDSESIAALGARVGINDLQDRFDVASLKVSRGIINSIRDGMSALRLDPTRKVIMPINGLKYGVSTIEEISPNDVALKLHSTDHFTFLVSNEVFKGLRQKNHRAVSDTKLRAAFEGEQNNLGFFFNSLGLNASIVIGDQYLVGIRPDGNRHVAMNKGLAKEPDTAPDIASWFARGMKNELGIEPAPGFALSEVFMVPSVGQLGIHVLAQVDSELDTVCENHAGARDAWENQRLMNVPYKPAVLKVLANSKEPTIGYTRGLWANLANNWN